MPAIENSIVLPLIETLFSTAFETITFSRLIPAVFVTFILKDLAYSEASPPVTILLIVKFTLRSVTVFVMPPFVIIISEISSLAAIISFTKAVTTFFELV